GEVRVDALDRDAALEAALGAIDGLDDGAHPARRDRPEEAVLAEEVLLARGGVGAPDRAAERGGDEAPEDAGDEEAHRAGDLDAGAIERPKRIVRREPPAREREIEGEVDGGPERAVEEGRARAEADDRGHDERREEHRRHPRTERVAGAL